MYYRRPRLTQMSSGFCLIFSTVNAYPYISKHRIWSGVLIYTNVMFYSKLHLGAENTALFLAMLAVVLYGYFVLFEVALFVLILVLFALLLVCCPRRDPRPIRSVCGPVIEPSIGLAKETEGGEVRPAGVWAGQHVRDLLRGIHGRLGNRHSPVPR